MKLIHVYALTFAFGFMSMLTYMLFPWDDAKFYLALMGRETTIGDEWRCLTRVGDRLVERPERKCF